MGLAALVGSVVRDEAGLAVAFTVCRANPTTEAELGVSGHDLVAGDVSPAARGFLAEWLATADAVARTGVPATLVLRSDALARWLDVHVFRMGDGPEIAALFRNVTERETCREECEGRLEAASRHGEDLEAARLAAIGEKRRLEAVMEALPIGVAITDSAGGNVQSNHAYDQLWGGPRPVPRSVDDYVSYRARWVETGLPVQPDEWASAQAVLQGNAVTGQLIEIERFDGGRLVVLNSASPVRDADGRVVGSAVAVQDVTELRRAQEAYRESEARYRTLAENFRVALHASPVTVARLDTDLRFTWVHNTRHGFTPEEVIGRRPDELLPPGDVAELMALLERVRATGAPEQSVVSGRSGAARWDYFARVEPQFDEHGAWTGLTLAQIDITQRRQMEEALRETDRRRTQFIAMLSHELRNPLAPIRSALEVLKLAAPDSPLAARARAVAERQVDQLTRLVDDLLDTARVTSNKITLQRAPLDLAALVRQAAEDARPAFDANGVTFAATIGAAVVPVDGDAARLTQVVGNLLQNAAKFTPRGGRAELRLSVDAGARRATISVSDSGGISPDILPYLFQPLIQADATLDRSKGGLGLGLALVKALVDLHGGEVSAVSDGVGAGIEFRVDLPTIDALAPPERVPPPSVTQPRRVLIVEDNEDGAESLKELLRLAGHDAIVAHDGRSGIDTARALHPDVVLCDLGLPGMDGYAVAAALRADPALRPIVLVALSGYAMPEDLDRTSAAGFDAHLAKPPDIEVLLRLIGTLQAPARPGRNGRGAGVPNPGA